MTILRTLLSLFALLAATAAFAADPTGTWQWSTHSKAGDIPTTLTLASKDGHVSGAYSNQFGDTAISNPTLQADVITFDVVRTMGGKPYIVHYHGKIEVDTITGTIEAPGHDGGPGVKLPWTATRAPKHG